jgi:glucose/arabinose dehydrogenase
MISAAAGPVRLRGGGDSPNADAVLRGFWAAVGATMMLLVLAGCGGRSAPPVPDLAVELIASGLTNPVFVTAAHGDNSRLFVLEQTGMVRVVELATRTVREQPFLDLSDEIEMGHEQGLLGLAFHPKFAENGTFYVNFIAPGGAADEGVTVVRQYRVSAIDPNVADAATAKDVLRIEQPQANHNGGWIGFSPRAADENNLYIATGDGGAAFDEGRGHIEPGGNSQSLASLHGKVLRIHVDPQNGSYTIPQGNPFTGPAARGEIWLYGLRNPFRCSFDRGTGDLWIADAGQDEREEVNIQPATNPRGGENYGWRLREGRIATPGRVGGARPRGNVEPFFDYARDVGLCVIGGYVYRGSAIPELQGAYVFGDYSGKVYLLRRNGKRAGDFRDITRLLFPSERGMDLQLLSSFGEDAAGELYLVSLSGSVWKIVPATR